MRSFLRVIIFLLFAIAITSRAAAQSGSNMGKEFYTTFADHIYQPGLPGNAMPKSSSMVLYIKATVATTVTVELFGGATSVFNVPAGQTYEYQVAPGSFVGNLSNSKLNKAIHITASNNVAVFAELYGVGGGVGVTSATMLLPVKALGQDYRSLNYTQLSNSTLVTPAEGNSYSFFDVVATTDNTTIQITLPAGVTIYNGDPAQNLQTNAPAQITLNRGDVYQALSDNDLTGARIKVITANGSVCNPVAVFCGSTKIYLGNAATNCVIYKTSDNLFQQVTPTSTWGNHFITTPLKGRESELAIYRVQFNDVSTNYSIAGNYKYLQQDKTKGYVELYSAEPLVITADGPIQVAQYPFTQFMVSCPVVFTPGDTGDPDMIYLTPLEQGVDSASFYSTGRHHITNSYVNVVLPSAAVTSFKIDGSSTLPAGVNFATVPGNVSYSFARIPVTTGLNDFGSSIATGNHTITASQPFVATAYGFGNYESYGYTVGAAFSKKNRSVALNDASSGNNVKVNACSGLSYTPQVTLPFKVDQITWLLDGSAINVQQNPAIVSTGVQNDQTVYTYKYQNAAANSASVYISSGSHQVTANYQTPYENCQETTAFNINVLDAPIPAFTSAGACAGEPVALTLNTPSSMTGVNSLTWNFGDGSAAASITTASLVHTYAMPGDYQVSVTVNYANGCGVISAPAIVHITAKPIAGFSYSSSDLTPTAVKFADISDPKGNIITWLWDFGDGHTSTEQNPAHVFPTANSYSVKLTVTNSSGCVSSTFAQTIVIYPLPTADLTAPDICLDGGKEQFTNTTNFNGNDPAHYTYRWDFGDTASPANTSALKNPQHIYSKAGNYTVNLSVISSSGYVVATINKQIVVNASNPTAAFAVNNAGSLCTGEAVVFQDKTTLITGDLITKVVWNWGDGSADEIYTGSAIHTDGIYHHLYQFNSGTPATQSYNVTLTEYTGLTCASTVSQTIVVSAKPVITIIQPAEVCQNSPVFAIAVNTNGFTGIGSFKGDGITFSGRFDPAAAGVGTHAISYVFTSTLTGCTYGQTFNIKVNTAPTVSAGPDQLIQQGRSVTLNATATGDNLTYKWIPSAGLDRDDVLNPVASPSDDTKYTLTVTSASGCNNSSQVSVTVQKIPKPANAFTPNGDGINDQWHIGELEKYTDATVDVFNRIGSKVFSSIGYSVPWDGKFNGNDLPVGVYYYIVTLKNIKKVISGYVTIVR